MKRNALWLFGVTIIIFALFLPSYTKMQDLRSRNDQYEQQIVQLKKDRERLLEEERRLRDDPEYQEKIIRQEMGVIRKGEVIYRVVPE
ncbi:MAG TPA: septum formation initiator family protein [Candidatus Omnitrophota bacterium]|nr:septum formation initiator family protein [Candidatus Omnitrophota bacterium]